MKRFTSEEEIIQLIDRFNTEIVALGESVDSKEHLADSLRSTEEAWRIDGIRERVSRLKKQIDWRHTRVQNLGHTLAEFRTPQLPGVDNGDRSVPTS